VILESQKYTMPSSKVSTVNLRFLPKLLNKRNIRRFIQDNLMGVVNGNCRVEIYIHLLLTRPQSLALYDGNGLGF
jgi:hypothetical protein